jgi:hypothetical protein
MGGFRLSFQAIIKFGANPGWPGSQRSAAARSLGLRVRIPLSVWVFVSCVCCVGSGLCDEQITRSRGSL